MTGQDEREALAWDLSNFLFSIYDHGTAPNAKGEADCILAFLTAKGFRRPTPHVVTTVEGLVDLFLNPVWFDLALRDNYGRLWIVWETGHGDYFATSQQYEDDENGDASHRPLSDIALPATVLTPAPAPAPADREAMVECLTAYHRPLANHPATCACGWEFPCATVRIIRGGHA